MSAARPLELSPARPEAQGMTLLAATVHSLGLILVHRDRPGRRCGVRVLVTAFPAVGHFHSVAPFALAARAAGHEVCVATAPDLVPWSITCGLPTRPIGPMLHTLVRRSDS